MQSPSNSDVLYLTANSRSVKPARIDFATSYAANQGNGKASSKASRIKSAVNKN